MKPSEAEDQVNPSREFLAQVAAHSPDALATLYDRYADRLYAVVLRLVADEDHAADLVHDIFVGLPRVIESFEGRGSFEGWLHRIAVRAALLFLRQQQNRTEILRRLFYQWPSQTEPHIVEALDLTTALDQLSADMRSVFVLKQVGGYTHEEIGQLLGITVSASKVRLHRARKRLHRLLKGY